MGLDITQVRDYIVVPALKQLNLYTVAACRLVLGTALVESNFVYIDQTTKGPGPAVSLWQIEKITHDDIWRNWLAYRPEFRQALKDMTIPGDDLFFQMHYNLKYAAAMCRMVYMRAKAQLPGENDAAGMAAYHKKWYNTYLGKTDPAKSVVHFERIIKHG